MALDGLEKIAFADFFAPNPAVGAHRAELAQAYGTEQADALAQRLKPHAGMLSLEMIEDIRASEAALAKTRFEAERDVGLHNDTGTTQFGGVLRAVLAGEMIKPRDAARYIRLPQVGLAALDAALGYSVLSEVTVFEGENTQYHTGLTLPQGVFEVAPALDRSMLQVNLIRFWNGRMGSENHNRTPLLEVGEGQAIRIVGGDGSLWQSPLYTPEGVKRDTAVTGIP